MHFQDDLELLEYPRIWRDIMGLLRFPFRMLCIHYSRVMMGLRREVPCMDEIMLDHFSSLNP